MSFERTGATVGLRLAAGPQQVSGAAARHGLLGYAQPLRRAVRHRGRAAGPRAGSGPAGVAALTPGRNSPACPPRPAARCRPRAGRGFRAVWPPAPRSESACGPTAKTRRSWPALLHWPLRAVARSAGMWPASAASRLSQAPFSLARAMAASPAGSSSPAASKRAKPLLVHLAPAAAGLAGREEQLRALGVELAGVRVNPTEAEGFFHGFGVGDAGLAGWLFCQ